MTKKTAKKVESQMVHLSVPVVLLADIDQFQQENGYTTRTAAILELLRKGMKSKE